MQGLGGLNHRFETAEIEQLFIIRDSLDAVDYSIPSFPQNNKNVTLEIQTQKEWNELYSNLKRLLGNGENQIFVKVSGNNLVFGENEQSLSELDYPNANIWIDGRQSRMIAYGKVFKRSDSRAVKNGSFYVLPYWEYDLNDVALDKNGNEIPLREKVESVNGDIESVKMSQQRLWRFKVDLPDLDENLCNDFYVLITREWTSGRHKVLKVEDGWLYCLLETQDIEDDVKDLNVDWTHYKVRPRYCLINSPVSSGVHVVNGYIYIPNNYSIVRINKGGNLIGFNKCHFNSLVIEGFKLNGCGDGNQISIYSCQFDRGAFINNNQFNNLSGLAIYSGRSNNVTVSNNIIKNTREGAIECSGKNTTICKNYLKNIGWMLNTRAIIGGGNILHICDNTIEDFNYAAINCGRRIANRSDFILNYIVERNIVRLTKEYTDNYLLNTLADGGGIYIGPQCTRGIIRFNVIENMKGIHSNRGVFLDDGAKNLSIYGNLVINTSNSYDIDLRYTDSFASLIPDHNTNNSVFQNIITGVYRFQDAGESSNCIGGNNLLINDNKKPNIKLARSVPDIRLRGGKYKKGKIYLPKRDKVLLDSLKVDRFIMKFISFN